jgi:hypothetical protein
MLNFLAYPNFQFLLTNFTQCSGNEKDLHQSEGISREAITSK